jgi:hypothetical protein
MSAGTGIAHSEYNASSTDLVHLLQIWILPNKTGIEPSYEQKHFPLAERQGKLQLVASGDGRDNSVTIHQDAELYLGTLQNGDRINYETKDNRSLWIQVAKGAIKVNGKSLDAGDGAGIEGATNIAIASTTDNAEVLLFDLAS